MKDYSKGKIYKIVNDENDKSHMVGNFLAKLFGFQVPSLKDLISRS